jgi:GntR family transcriptional regulator/MocR family aminotransferase
MVLLTHQSCLHKIPVPQKLEPDRGGKLEVKTTIRVNRKRPESMTKQITDQLTSLIESGAMTVGSYLPSERELANSLKVARNVVRGSYENLIKAGRVQSEGRKGRTVRSAGKKRASAAKGSKSAGAKARKK